MWSLFDGEKELKPLCFSNGKNQEDIVKEVLESIKQGNKVIFIRGTCGSGKSAVALNIAKELGRASIVVPIKNLQKQYERDYMGNKFVIKNNGEKLKISMITGRNNHECLYIKENEEEILEKPKKEINSNLNDILNIFNKNNKKDLKGKKSADNPYIPCKIELKEKNMDLLKKYYFESKERKKLNEMDIKNLKRFVIGCACPYWNPILSSEIKINLDSQKKCYPSLSGEHCIYLRKSGCSYYEQFKSYIDSDVIMFNSAQYLLETWLGRKPKTEVEIIDECDDFLDNLANEGVINLNRLKNEASFLFSKDYRQEKMIEELQSILRKVLEEAKQKYLSEEIIQLKESIVFDLIKLLAKREFILISEDDEGYLEKCSEVARDFEEMVEDSHLSFYKSRDREEYGIKLVTINLDKVFNALFQKNKVLILMSGTLHSERVLKDIFGIENFKIIEAETVNQGEIIKKKIGVEEDFKYENFRNGKVNRKQYLLALEKCVNEAKRPAIVHVNAFSDLPSEIEKENFGLNLISNQELMDLQDNDKEGKLVNDFKNGKKDILFTTKCNRGVDFPFETCNSVVITKFPYPNTQSLFWQILKKQKPLFFWEFYKDKAHRELLQKIYRSVRAKNDKVELLSPDIRVLDTKIF